MSRIALAKRLYDQEDGLGPERLINCMVQALTEDKSGPYKVTHVPGLSRLETISGACRGLWFDPTSVEGDILGVFGNDLYTIDSSWTATDTSANVASSTGRVRFAASNSEVAILSANTLYSWDGATLTTVTDMDAPTFADVCYLGGRFIGLDANTEDWYYSDTLDATSWTSLGYISSEYEPDRGVACCPDNDDLVLFGRSISEIFGVTADADNPYQRRLGAVIQKGCLARDSVVRADNSIFFVGDDCVVHRLNGVVPIRVSKPWIEAKIEALSSANQALIECDTFVQNGQTIVQVSLPGEGTYWFNTATGEWNERATASANEALCRVYPQNRQRGGSGRAFGAVVSGGRTGNLYQVDRDTFTDDETAITRTLTANLRTDSGSVVVDTLALTGTPGRASAGSPTCALSWSDDGGRTFSSTVSRSIGAAGDYDLPVLWQGLGMTGPQGRTFKFDIASAAAYDVTAVRVNEPLPF